MCRIQNFIVGMKEEERRLKQEEAKKKDPLAQKGSNNVAIPRCLRYPGTDNSFTRDHQILGETETVRLKMHPMHRTWCSSDVEATYVGKIQSFIDHLDWQAEEDTRGGITWLELYILYSSTVAATMKLKPLSGIS